MAKNLYRNRSYYSPYMRIKDIHAPVTKNKILFDNQVSKINMGCYHLPESLSFNLKGYKRKYEGSIFLVFTRHSLFKNLLEQGLIIDTKIRTIDNERTVYIAEFLSSKGDLSCI